jgi:hypothetical protein
VGGYPRIGRDAAWRVQPESDRMSDSSQLPGATGGADPAPTRRRDSEFWIAIGALVVSAIAMASSLVQVNLQRNQERALVWPHVSAGPAYSGSGYAYVARNKGLGPALVRHVAISVDGQPVDGWNAVLDRVLGSGHGYGWERIEANDLADTILAAGESVTLFRVAWDERTRAGFGAGNRIATTVCYCSFLEECWITRAGLDHTRVDRCPVSD